MLSLCPFDISVGVGAFVIGLSQISSFFSFHFVIKYPHVRTRGLSGECVLRIPGVS